MGPKFWQTAERTHSAEISQISSTTFRDRIST